MSQLASIEGLIFWAVIAGVFWVVKVIQGSLQTADKKAREAQGQLSQRGSRESMRGQPARDSEEERTRKFLEALGLPPQDATRQTTAPTSLRPKEPRPARQAGDLKPVPPIVVPTFSRPRPKQPPRLPPEMPRSPLPPVQDPVPRDWTREASVIQEVHLPTLPVAEVAEYQTYSSRVSATPGLVSETTPRVKRKAAVAEFDPRDLVRTPEALRSAIILREILGPPRSLQSFGESPSLHVP
jgi:hypothetical protein